MTAETVSDTVAANIRAARKRRGWTVADLARRSGLSVAIIENIEHGRRRDGVRVRDITVDELDAVAAGLGVPPAALYPGLEASPGSMTVFESAAAVRELAQRLTDMADVTEMAQGNRNARKA